MPKHIGIAAVSPQGSAVCYSLIGRKAAEIKAPADRPLITLHNRPFASYLDALERQDWGAIADLLLRTAQSLRAAGAEFCVLPDNVAHHALHLAEPTSPIPWLNMISLVAESVQARGCKRVGIIGTKLVTYGSTYQTALGLKGIHLNVPDQDDGDAIDRIIFAEAVRGVVSKRSLARVIHAVTELADNGCEALILGSSEASIMIDADESPLPIIDPIELLAERAIAFALGQGA